MQPEDLVCYYGMREGIVYIASPSVPNGRRGKLIESAPFRSASSIIVFILHEL